MAVMLVTSIINSAQARPPEIRNVNMRGFQIGQPTVVTIDGVDLLPAPKLLLGANAVEATLDDKQSNANRLVLTATLPNETTPGLAQLRLATNEGISNSVVVALDRMPRLPIAETVTALPVSLHGSVPGSGSSKTSFTGKAGDDVMIEVEAKRLGSKLRPVLHLFDARRTQVAWAMPSRTLSGDCRLATKLPRDGQYTIELHDLQYAPPGVSFFRLKIGQWQFADLAFPPAVTRGQEVALELLGGTPGLKLPFKAVGDSDVLPVSWPLRAGIPVAERLDYGGPPPIARRRWRKRFARPSRMRRNWLRLPSWNWDRCGAYKEAKGSKPKTGRTIACSTTHRSAERCVSKWLATITRTRRSEPVLESC